MPTATTDTWRQVDVGKLLTLLLDKREHDDDEELAAVGSTVSDVMPLAASSSLTLAKYPMSGYPNLQADLHWPVKYIC